MTTLDIWNMALGFLGTRTVAAATENTPEAVHCRLFYPSARQQVLREYPWSFALRRVRLAAKGVPEVWNGVWNFAYAEPQDCLKIHGLDSGNGQRVLFQLAQSEDGTRLVLSNTGHALANITVDVNDASRFEPLFCHVLARKLACLVAVPLLKNNSGKVQELEQLYRASLPAAHDASASERRMQPEEDSWIAARGGDYA